LQLPSELVPKILKARNATVVSLLIGWGFMASPALRKKVGHFHRHLSINSILKGSLTRIGLPSVLESVGVTRYGRRPDGLTLNPWYRGRSLVWDTTVAYTFAQSHYIVSVTIPSNVATYADC